ncbi:CaiB/BaiF CoA transferase family protein [Streptomyces tsukubensis]|uniref:CaiB/BaiF CoA transferase family protein n=1 Tax=Streptomyces tsukubensis TaxID=83656 RepID=UPI0036A8E574
MARPAPQPHHDHDSPPPPPEPARTPGTRPPHPPGPLAGTLVLDLATLFAGPLAATVLGDFGAEVIKVEHPAKGDPSRTHGPAKDGHGLWWKMLGRNKKAVTCDLGTEEGAELLRALAADADVLIENFRPGTLERWGLAPEELRRINPRLVIARVTGFGQFGPYARRPGFGTLAESMSGFAAATGEPDGPPTLPPFGLADGIAALTCVNAILMALRHRDTGQGDGRGQIVDLAIIEPLVTLLGPQPMIWDQLGRVQERTGNRSVNNAPRNTYRTRDGRWVAVSTSAQNIAERVMRLVGHPEVIDEPWFSGGAGRAAHADLLDAHVGDWIAARDATEVVDAFEAAQAAVALVYDIRDVFDDPQYRALDTVTTVDDPDLGPLRMQNVLFRLSETPGSIRSTGAAVGAHNAEVYGERLGLGPDDLDRLHAKGVI